MAGSSVGGVIPAEMRGKKLDEALAAIVADHSKALLQKLVRKGRVKVDGRIVKRSNVRVRGGERIVVELDTPPGARGSELRVVHEDDSLVVIDKPAGLLTHPNEKEAGGTLSDLLEERFGRLPRSKGDDRPGIVHRLDRETSGLVVAARTPEAMDGLENQFRRREVSKIYRAIVHGVPSSKRFESDRPIVPFEGARDRMALGRDGEGKPSHTEFELDEAFEHFALVTCRPTSGRRHQIRLHLLDVGHPIVSDKLYGRKDSVPLPDGAPKPRRHALHAEALSFVHPRTSERLSLRAPLPRDLATLLAWLRD